MKSAARYSDYDRFAWVYKLKGKKTKAIADFEKFITLTDNPQLIQMARQQIDELKQKNILTLYPTLLFPYCVIT